MSSKLILLTSLAWLLPVVLAQGDTLPDCDCYFTTDCPAAKPVCSYDVGGGGPLGAGSPTRTCEWRTPKPVGTPGSGCDQPFTGGPGPCDGVCVGTGPVVETREWNHRDGRPGPPYQGSGCLPGGPYSYFVKLIVENEACDLPEQCSLCESETFIPAGTLAAGTASLVEATLTTDCSAAGFSFEVMGTEIHAELTDQVFDVCVNGVNVTSSTPPGQAIVCQDGTSPVTHQLAGLDLPVEISALSTAGFAFIVSAILVALLGHHLRLRRS